MANGRPGRPKGYPRSGGRQKGTPNHATNEIKELARKYAPDALERIVKLSESATNENVKLLASKELLDRAYGKPTQAITSEGGGPIDLKFTFCLDRPSDSDDSDDGGEG